MLETSSESWGTRILNEFLGIAMDLSAISMASRSVMYNDTEEVLDSVTMR